MTSNSQSSKVMGRPSFLKAIPRLLRTQSLSHKIIPRESFHKTLDRLLKAKKSLQLLILHSDRQLILLDRKLLRASHNYQLHRSARANHLAAEALHADLLDLLAKVREQDVTIDDVRLGCASLAMKLYYEWFGNEHMQTTPEKIKPEEELQLVWFETFYGVWWDTPSRIPPIESVDPLEKGPERWGPWAWRRVGEMCTGM